MRGRGFRRSLSKKDVAPTGNVLSSSRVLLREIPAGEMRPLLKRDRHQPYQWAEGYPTEGTLIAGKAYMRQIDEKRWRPGFGMYQIVRRSDRTIIGDSGFLSAPDPQGRVALGYGLAPSARGHGYATEALIALTRWALDQPGIVVVTADTSHDNVKSQAVMERAGFREVRSDEELRYYEARRPD
jgi:RimJ/RimL family protein N-acetyltransferase